MSSLSVERQKCRSSRQAGSSFVEFVLVVIPLMGLLLLTIDVSWSLFARATLQNAARQGVRYAVTGQTSSANTCLGSSVQQVVSQNSFGFIPPNMASSLVSVQYYSPATLSPITGAGATAGGNIVEVSISGVSLSSFGPIFRNSFPLAIGANASDVLESPPNGVAPCP